MAQQQTIDFGIDLGTTNSAIAKYIEGEVIIFKNPITIKETLPSVVAFKGDKVIVGDKANELLSRKPQHVFGTFKRKMGTSDRYYLESQDRFLSPIDLSAIVLKELKKFIHTGEQVRSVAITIPAAFDTIQSNATKQAGYDAGFEEVVLLQEPIAASLAYANSAGLELSDGKWLVYDLGGGTFDVALASAKDGEMKVVDHEGDNYLGGSDFDRMIVEQFVVPALDAQGTFDDLLLQLKTGRGRMQGMMNKLMLLCEEAKKVLTHADSAEIEFDIEDDADNELEVYLELSRNKFEEIIRPVIQRTIDMIVEMLNRNAVNPSELKHILLIGGSTYIPLVRQMLEQQFDIEINAKMDPTTAVVKGAAYYAGLKVSQLSPATAQAETISVSGYDSTKVNVAYERVIQDEAAPVMIQSQLSGYTYRIYRSDGAYDSGSIELKAEQFEMLPLLSNTNNKFTFEVVDAMGNVAEQRLLLISHGKFSIDGQPLPHSICIEVDAIKDETTYLEPVFKKNAILPLKKTITKQVSKTILQGSNDSVDIKVIEGAVDSLPAANRLVGLISITGNDLERDLVKGSDIELTFEVSESRDVTVAAYLTLTDQEFVNTFSPVEVYVDKNVLLKELNQFRDNLNRYISKYENESQYEQAAQIKNMLGDIAALESEVIDLDEDDQSDAKYQLELKKREIGQKIFKRYSSSYLTSATEKYMQQRNVTREYVHSDEGTPEDIAAYEAIVKDERAMLQSGDVTRINIQTDRLESLKVKVGMRRKISKQEMLFYFQFYKNMEYGADQTQANKYIQDGEKAINDQNDSNLMWAISSLAGLMKEEREEKIFKSDSTGLK